jgi:hypothetical protein
MELLVSGWIAAAAACDARRDPRYTWYDFRFFGDLTKMISERIRIHRANDLIKNKFEVFILLIKKIVLPTPSRPADGYRSIRRTTL